MARPSFQTLPGTRDLLPPDTGRRRALIEAFAVEAERAGFGEIVTPMFEDLGVFTRIGESTDVVSKELYAFQDQGGRDQALRPEFTASVCRAYAQHRPLTPWKTWYAGPAFRQEKPQKGRYRQFDQVGAEVIGSHDPDLDVELIALAARFFDGLGLRDVTLLLNTLGDAEDRPRYLDVLRAHFGADLDALSEQSRATLEINPLRVLDSKRPQDADLVAAAPLLVDYVSDEALAAFERVQAGLTALGVSFELAPRLVRGLDYYTRTTFEFAATSLDAAQNAVGGGGRYDGLVADLGGPPEPGVGFALGVDRTLLACDSEDTFPAAGTDAEVFVVATTGGLDALELADELRRAGIRAERGYDHRSMKAQMKGANRSGAAVAVIVGESEAADSTVTIRPLRAENQEADRPQFAVARTDMLAHVKELLSK
ncbi:MAG: histidine--tRNA ligase [Acidimicrobiales bacterium]